jgi:hypothetical protein
LSKQTKSTDTQLKIMEFLQSVYHSILSPNSIWSVVARGGLWLAVAVVVLVSVDKPDPDKSLKDLKSNLGFLVLFLVLSGTLMYLLFGYAPKV